MPFLASLSGVSREDAEQSIGPKADAQVGQATRENSQ